MGGRLGESETWTCELSCGCLSLRLVNEYQHPEGACPGLTRRSGYSYEGSRVCLTEEFEMEENGVQTRDDGTIGEGSRRGQ